MSDITYIPTDEGWLYCAAHKDLFHGEIVGYALGARMTKSLVARSLARAVSVKHPPKGPYPSLRQGEPVLQPEVPKTPHSLGDGGLHEQKG